eukprot:TRINITY_DN17535_c0_g1_i1.p1 TRINITY_DN17535_c0_g1~~TRINITY_DN17535_c0_g1_i1.p1  ORF type:complete len:583 (+),score=78.02 TRINITY_DN17535_c0_g1_i1:87-1835(+)
MDIHLLPEQPASMSWLNVRKGTRRQKKKHPLSRYATEEGNHEINEHLCSEVRAALENNSAGLSVRTRTSLSQGSTRNKISSPPPKATTTTRSNLVPCRLLHRLKPSKELPHLQSVCLDSALFKHPLKKQRQPWSGALPRNTNKLVKLVLTLSGSTCAFAVAQIIGNAPPPNTAVGTKDLYKPKLISKTPKKSILSVTADNKINRAMLRTKTTNGIMKGRLFHSTKERSSHQADHAISDFSLTPVPSQRLVPSEIDFMSVCGIAVGLVVCCASLLGQEIFTQEVHSCLHSQFDITIVSIDIGTATLKICPNGNGGDTPWRVSVSQYDVKLPSQPLLVQSPGSYVFVGEKLLESMKLAGWEFSPGDLRVCLSLPNTATGVSQLRNPPFGRCRQWSLSYSMAELAALLCKKKHLPIVCGAVEHLLDVNLRMELVYCNILKDLLCSESGLSSLMSVVVNSCVSFYASSTNNNNHDIISSLRGVEGMYFTVSIWQVGYHEKKDLPPGTQLVVAPQFQQPGEDLPRPLRIYRKVTPPPVILEEAISNRRDNKNRFGSQNTQRDPTCRTPQSPSRLWTRDNSNVQLITY